MYDGKVFVDGLCGIGLLGTKVVALVSVAGAEQSLHNLSGVFARNGHHVLKLEKDRLTTNLKFDN